MPLPSRQVSEELGITPMEVSPPPEVERVEPAPIETPIEVFTPSPDIPSLVTVIITNFKTKRLVRDALATMLKYYPHVPVLLVDNGSGDDSTKYIKQAGEVFKTVTSLLYERNLGHGPAMNEAIRVATTKYVFTMDTDCVVKKGGFLEAMLEHFQANPDLYAIGWLRHVDRLSGVPAPNKLGFMEYVHPSAALYDREKYLTLAPFSHHGAPATANMREAHEAGYKLLSFPISDYIHHLIAGTRRMYGGRWDPRASDAPGAWEEGRAWPI
jgi:glycosyltransferase involved in cell wall biosynthesis